MFLIAYHMSYAPQTTHTARFANLGNAQHAFSEMQQNPYIVLDCVAPIDEGVREALIGLLLGCEAPACQ